MRVGSLEIEIMTGIARIQKDMNDVQRIVGGSMANVEKSVASAKRAMQTLGVGLPLLGIIDQVRRMTDQYTKLDAQLRLSTKTQAQYAQGMSDIRRISSIAQADISATSMLYTRLINVMQGTGIEQSKLATVTETVSFGLKAYGATAQEASSAALQLSQAMGANRLGGEEFRAVMEAMPNVMKVVADSMSESEGRKILLGDLRQLSIEGKITADVLVKALGDPAIAAQFKAMAENTQTVTGAWVVARNELMLLVGEFGKSSGGVNIFIGAFKAMGETFALLAKCMQSLMFIAGGYVTFLVTKMVVGTVLAIEKSIAHTEALAMNAAMTLRASQQEASLAAAKAATASATAASTVSLLRNTIATVEANAATLAKTVADNAATIAQLNHARSVAQLSGHYYIIRQVEAELVVTTQALAVAQTELNASTARQTRLQAALIAEDKAALRARGDLVKANAAVVVSQNAATASAIGNIAAIGVALRTATMAHPITAAALAISAIVVAIANWKDIVDGSKASFTWFMDEFIGGIRFLAEGVGISLGELVQKMSLLANLTWPDLKSGEFKKQWDKLGELAEQSRVEAAARLRGIDQETRDREKLELAVRQMQERDAWDKLHATKQQQRTAEVAELNAQYVKLAGLQGRSQAEQMQLAEDYRVKMALIDEKYNREAVKAAGNAHTTKMQQTLATLQAEAAAEEGKLSRVQKVSLEYQALKTKEQTLAEYGVFVLALEQAALLDARDAQEALNKQLASGTEAYNDFWAGVEQSTEKLLDQSKQQEFENTLIGKTKTEIAALTKLREAETIAKEEANLAAMKLNGAYAEEILKQQALIDAMKRKRDADVSKTDIEAAQAAIDAQTKAAEEQWKMIDGFAHTAFDNIFDKGRDTFKEIGNAIKKYVLDMLYKMTVQKWMISVGIGGTAASGAAGAADNVAGGMNGVGMLGNIAGVVGSFGAGISGAMSMGIINGFSAGMTSIAAQGFSSYAAGLMAPGVGLAAVAVYAIARKLMSNGGTPTSSTGDASLNFSASGAMTGRNSMGNYNALATDAADTFVKKMNEGYLDAAKNLGITAAATTFAFAANTGKDGKAPMFGIGGGVTGGTYYNSAETAISDAAMTLEQSRAIFTALRDSVTESSGYLMAAFNQISDVGKASQAQIDAAMRFAQALHQTRAALTETRSPLEILAQNVNTGMASLGTSAETFKTDFLAAIDLGTMTPELLANWAAIGGGLDQLAQVSAQAAVTVAAGLAQMGNTGFATDLANTTASATMSAVTAAMPWITNIGQLATISAADFAQYGVVNQGLISDAITAAAQAQQHVTQPSPQTSPSYDYAPGQSYSGPDNSAADKAAQDALALANIMSGIDNSAADKAAQDALALANIMSGIDYTALTLGMSTYEKSLLDITRATDASVTQATLLGATEAQLATIRALGVAQALEVTIAAEKARVDATKTLSEQLFALQHTEAENMAHMRELKLAELTLQETQLGMAAGTLTAIQNQIDAQTDLNAANAKATALDKTNQGWQDQIDILNGVTTARDQELRGVDSTTAALMKTAWAAQDAKAGLDKFNSAMSSLGSRQQGLDVQLLGAQGNDVGALALARRYELAAATTGDAIAGLTAAQVAEIKAKYEAIYATEDAITAANAAAQAAAEAAQAAAEAARAQQQAADEAARAQQQAADEAARAQQQAADEAARAAEQIKSAWQSVTDSIFNEVARIRGLLGQGGIADAQSRFAIATAQARAGDQEAARLLPALSQAMLEMAAASASTAAELARMQGRTAASLTTTGEVLAAQYGLSMPSYAVGTPSVPFDMVAQIHKGERIIPAASNDALLEEMRALRVEVSGLRASSEKTAESTGKTTNILRNVTQDGNSLLTTAA